MLKGVRVGKSQKINKSENIRNGKLLMTMECYCDSFNNYDILNQINFQTEKIEYDNETTFITLYGKCPLFHESLEYTQYVMRVTMNSDEEPIVTFQSIGDYDNMAVQVDELVGIQKVTSPTGQIY